jgi:hypothetical protein
MGRHEHTPVPDGQGRLVCRFCNQVIIKPITSSDDPRLTDAGLHRSGGDQFEQTGYPPLPEMLITLYHAGPEFMLAKAPAAHYVHLTAQEEGRRFELSDSNDPGDIWAMLHRKLVDNGASKC